MNTAKAYALLVGINDYPGDVAPLQACCNDALKVHQLLRKLFPGEQLVDRILLNERATRKNVIAGFREHLSQAKKHDLAFFYFAGHGALLRSAPELDRAGLSSEGMDEALVCYDSRLAGGLDLADKELAFLIEEVAENGARVILVMDACHSGGATRTSKDLSHDFGPELRTITGRIRNWNDHDRKRDLDSYLSGAYSSMSSLRVPEAPHIVLSACKSRQEAYEIHSGGLFTYYFLRSFEDLGNDPVMSHLFNVIQYRMRMALDGLAQNQEPQIDYRGGCDPHLTLTGKQVEKRGGRSLAIGAKLGGEWYIDHGSFHGARVGGIAKVQTSTGAFLSGKIVEVGLFRSQIELKEDPGRKVTLAKCVPQPAEPVRVELRGQSDYWKEMRELAFWEYPWLKFVRAGEGEILIEWEPGEFVLKEPMEKVALMRIPIQGGAGLKRVFDHLAQVLRWKMGKELASGGSVEQDVDFYFVTGNPMTRIDGPKLSLVLDQPNDQKRVLINARNHSYQPLYFTLIYFTREFGVKGLGSYLVPPNGNEVVMYGQDQGQHIYLPDCYKINQDTLRLLVTKEKPPKHLAEQKDMGFNSHARHRGSKQTEESFLIKDWAWKDLFLELVAGEPSSTGPPS